MADTDATALASRLADTVATAADPDVWTVAADGPGVCLTGPDRTLRVERRDGPDGTPRWTVVLRADGATVSKFGPLASHGAVADEVRPLLDTSVHYTVCCDG